jgi:tetratricopeptide (TPR) repeat protein
MDFAAGVLPAGRWRDALMAGMRHDRSLVAFRELGDALVDLTTSHFPELAAEARIMAGLAAEFARLGAAARAGELDAINVGGIEALVGPSGEARDQEEEEPEPAHVPRAAPAAPTDRHLAKRAARVRNKGLALERTGDLAQASETLASAVALLWGAAEKAPSARTLAAWARAVRDLARVDHARGVDLESRKRLAEAAHLLASRAERDPTLASCLVTTLLVLRSRARGQRLRALLLGKLRGWNGRCARGVGFDGVSGAVVGALVVGKHTLPVHPLTTVRCPRCAWRPTAQSTWQCTCGTRWLTFDTGGTCPACEHAWEDTHCLGCHERSPHTAWYTQDLRGEEVRILREDIMSLRRRVERKPEDVDARHVLATCLDRMAHLDRRDGRVDEALACGEEAVALMARLVADHPRDQFERDFSVAARHHARALVSAGAAERALPLFEDVLASALRRATANTQSAPLLTDVAAAYWQVFVVTDDARHLARAHDSLATARGVGALDAEGELLRTSVAEAHAARSGPRSR